MARSKKRKAAESVHAFQGTASGAKVPADHTLWRAEDGGTYLPVLPKFRKGDIDGSCHSVWRYRAMLPMEPGTPEVTLGEGGTPVVEVSIVGMPVYVKLDYMQPTGSFKDRGSAVLASALAAGGAKNAVEDSSGNADPAWRRICHASTSG